MRPPRPETKLAEFRAVFEVINRRRLGFLLMGGHAANLWGQHYLAGEPDLRQFFPLTSKDLDLLGDVPGLTTLAAELGLPVRLTRKAAPTPVVGSLEFHTPQGVASKVEVLISLHGVTPAELRQGAALLHDPDLGLVVAVPSPFACLKAKTGSVAGLDQQNRQDLKHLQILLLCVRSFLRETISDVGTGAVSERQAVNPLEALLKFTQSVPARRAGGRFEIGWLKAFPLAELQATSRARLRRFYDLRLRRAFPACPPPTS